MLSPDESEEHREFHHWQDYCPKCSNYQSRRNFCKATDTWSLDQKLFVKSCNGEHFFDSSIACAEVEKTNEPKVWTKYCKYCDHYNSNSFVCSAVLYRIRSQEDFDKYCGGEKFVGVLPSERPRLPSSERLSAVEARYHRSAGRSESGEVKVRRAEVKERQRQSAFDASISFAGLLALAISPYLPWFDLGFIQLSIAKVNPLFSVLYSVVILAGGIAMNAAGLIGRLWIPALFSPFILMLVFVISIANRLGVSSGMANALNQLFRSANWSEVFGMLIDAPYGAGAYICGLGVLLSIVSSVLNASE